MGYIIKDVIYLNYQTNKYIITSVTKKNEQYELKLKNLFVNILVKTKDSYKVGDILIVNGTKEEYIIHYPNQFDYERYLHNQNIQGVYFEPDIKKINNIFTISKINDYLKRYIDNTFNEEVSAYIKTLVLGIDDDLDKTNINILGISHLFVISGLHISIIILFITKILDKLKVKESKKKIIIIVITTIYLIITNFLISLIRVYLSLILKNIIKNKNNLDILSINFLIVVILNPFIIYSFSFILTYLIAFFMNLYNNVINLKNKHLNNLVNTFILTMLIQLLTLPITVSFSGDFNLLSILVNPIYIYFVSFILLPLSFVTLFIPIISYVYYYFIIAFKYSLDFFVNIRFLNITLGEINIVFKLLYIICFYIFMYGLENKKIRYLSLIIVFILLWYNKGLFNIENKMYFLDIDNGEATLILSKSNQLVILIDSGDVINSKPVLKCLKDLGVRKIDYLIITHSDNDHIGGSFEICKYIKINNLLLNCYDINNKTNYLKSYSKNTLYLKRGDSIKSKHFNLIVHSPKKDYGNINDNSLVFTLEIFNSKMLFTGDISKKVEQDLNFNTTYDFLKIPHHGSKTSSEVLLNKVKYRYAVIMNGFYNKFDFPNKEIVDMIPKNKQLFTKDYQTIKIVFKKRDFKINPLNK